ncbi:helix-turn-helix domain-containing protein [Caulobacter sp. KR2-114]|uniref:TetR/AcrR family transcriptional regulator n=1 Tax=Caulobacter sp. KR2-114 TaxID=3400912 RepID=UPI003C057979
MRLFHARGYDAVGVAELGAALGVKPPSFYAAFGSKAGLFHEALERYQGGEANLFAYALAQEGEDASAEAIAAGMLRRAAQVYPLRDGVAGCLVIDGARNSADPEARALTAAIKTEAIRRLTSFLRRRYPPAEHPGLAERLTAFVNIALAGMSAAARDGADRATLEAFAEASIRAFRREAAGEG